MEEKSGIINRYGAKYILINKHSNPYQEFLNMGKLVYENNYFILIDCS